MDKHTLIRSVWMWLSSDAGHYAVAIVVVVCATGIAFWNERADEKRRQQKWQD